MKIKKKKGELLRKALAVSVDSGDSDISSYLPTPLAMEVIDYIRDINLMRRLVKVFNMPARTYRKPKRNSGMSAYFIPDGVRATESGFTSTTVEWVAKKIMSYTLIDEEAVEDSQPNVIDQVLRDFGDAVAEAEEKAMLEGDPSHAATATDPASATSVNWYTKDSRLAFKGLFTLAAEADAATSVDGGGGAIDNDMVNKALYNLGKYGRNKTLLAGLLPSEQAANVRGMAAFNNAATAGIALAAYISGLGRAGEANGVVTNIYGVPFYEVPFGPEGKAMIMWKNSPELGDRRRIKVASDVIIEQDQRKYVISERVAFNVNYQEALVLIENLSTTIVS